MTERVESPTSATIADTSEQPATRGILRMLALMGPAFVAGAWQFGPGNLTTAVQAGSGYLYTLIWVIVVSTILMIFLTDMSVRLGIRSPISLIASIKDELGTWVGVLAGVGVFLITLCFSVGNAVGSGLGISLLVGGSPVMWSVIATIAVGALFLLRNVYQAVERVLVVIVALMAVAFIASTLPHGRIGVRPQPASFRRSRRALRCSSSRSSAPTCRAMPRSSRHTAPGSMRGRSATIATSPSRTPSPGSSRPGS